MLNMRGVVCVEGVGVTTHRHNVSPGGCGGGRGAGDGAGAAGGGRGGVWAEDPAGTRRSWGP